MFPIKKAWILSGSIMGFNLGISMFWDLNQPVFSQVIEAVDNPLGTVVSPAPGGNLIIQGGTPGGENLFHRFSQFDVLEGVTVTFEPLPGLRNIFSQVVSDAPSRIDGTIVVPDIDQFFLINSNGIVFGPGATLNIDGSFIATTADAVDFGAQGSFTEISQLTELGLLNVPPEALLFATAASRPTPISPFSIAVQGPLNLPSENGPNLFLIGGGGFPNGIGMQGGVIEALDRQVGLASLGESTRFNLDLFANPPENLSDLTAQINGELADISLTNNARIDVRRAAIGGITAFSRNLVLNNASSFRAGIGSGESDTIGVAPGDIEIRATGIISLTDGSFIENSLVGMALGSVGDITIRANSFEAIGTNPDASIPEQTRFSSGIYDRIQEGANGTPGRINIQVNSSFTLSRGAIVTASNNGLGKPGNIFIAADSINLIGQSDTITIDGSRQSSAVFSAVTGVGDGEGPGFTDTTDTVEIEIRTRDLTITDGAALISDTLGLGSASDITVIATGLVLLEGEGPDSDFRGSGLYSRVNPDANGDGGEIRISAGRLDIRNGATINATTDGFGNAGNITIFDTPQITVDGRGTLLDAEGQVSPSTIIADTSAMSFGQGGNLVFQNIGQLRVQNGAQVSALTRGSGPAGNLTINPATELVSVRGVGSQINFSSLSTRFTAGDAGILTIATPRLEVLDGGQVSARTVAGGTAGILQVTASDAVIVDGPGSSLLFDAQGGTNARGISIATNSLTVQNQGAVTVSGTGVDIFGNPGNPGDLAIAADTIFLNRLGRLEATTISGIGGNIPLQVGSLLFMTDGSESSASAAGGGDGGSVSITAPNGFILSRSIFEDNDIIATAASTGTGGVATARALLVEGFVETVGGDTPGISNFTASSAIGTDGITIIDAEPTPLEEIPLDFADARIAQSCRLGRRAEQSEFVVTGQGGVPPTPGEGLTIGEPEVGLVTVEDGGLPAVQSEPVEPSAELENPARTEIVEPQGWAYNEAGQLVLVAAVSPPIAPSLPLLNCYVLPGDR
jgi:filamentous hemagglutinin family protein